MKFQCIITEFKVESNTNMFTALLILMLIILTSNIQMNSANVLFSPSVTYFVYKWFLHDLVYAFALPT